MRYVFLLVALLTTPAFAQQNDEALLRQLNSAAAQLIQKTGDQRDQCIAQDNVMRAELLKAQAELKVLKDKASDAPKQ